MPDLESSQGMTFTFDGAEFKAKNVKVKKTRESIDISDCTLADNAVRKLQQSPLAHGEVITVEFWGLEEPDTDTSHPLSCAKLGISGTAFCTDYESNGAVGELLTGTASFTITG
jgi:hypothetical protein